MLDFVAAILKNEGNVLNNKHIQVLHIFPKEQSSQLERPFFN